MESSEKISAWRTLVGKIGVRYSACKVSNFETDNERMQAAKNAVFEYGLNLEQHVFDGDGLFLFGPPGTGKDHLMAGLMRLAVLGKGMSLDWFNGLDIYAMFRDSFQDDTREREIMRQFTRPDVLAISDPLPPWGQLTQYQASVLARIMDYRNRNVKSTWVTANFATADEGRDRLGASAFDRLRDGALTVFCNWKSHRKCLVGDIRK